MTGALAACMNKAIQPVSFTNEQVDAIGGGTQTATFTVDNDGTFKNQDGTVLQRWRNGGAVADYEVMFSSLTSVGGSPTGATVDTWLSCSTDRSLTVSTSGTEKITTFTVSIRYASGGSALDSAGVQIHAEIA